MTDFPYRPLHGQQCQCRNCGEAFRTVKAFDQHRTGPYVDRRCETPAVLREWGFSLDSKGFWRTPARTNAPAHWRKASPP